MSELNNSTTFPVNQKEFVAALIAFQKDLKPAAKSGHNPHFKSAYSTLEDVWDAIRPGLSANGLAITQGMESQGEKWVLITTLWHVGGFKVTCGTPILGATTPQSMGSALSYAKRYAIMAILGVPSEDDDGNAAEGGNKGKERNGGQRPQQSAGSKGTPPREYSQADWGDKRITDKQLAAIQTMAKKAGLAPDVMKDRIKKSYGKDSSKDLTQKEASQMIDALKGVLADSQV